MEHSDRLDVPVHQGGVSTLRMRRRTWLIWLTMCLALTLSGVGGFLRYIGVFGGNIRVVAENQVYRSALLPPAQLDQLIRERGIRTVITLCGGEAKDNWFRKEAEVCRRNGVDLRTLRFRATALPKPGELERLVTYYREAEYPILIHCKGGADRSGMASTIYLNEFAHLPLDEALKKGLTWHYGHFRQFAGPMDEFFEIYRQDSNGMDLATWIVERYPQLYQERKGNVVDLSKSGQAD